MFEKAREFRQKYYVAPAPASGVNHELIRANLILKKQQQEYSKKAAHLKSEILVMEREISLVKSEINEFLMMYYEKFADKIIEDGAVSTKQSPVEAAFDENDKMISLFEKRTEAYNKELKFAYRKLVKDFHPDVNDAVGLDYFHKIQNHYERGELDELLYLQSELCSTEEDMNIISKIEKLEAQINVYEKRLIRLIGEKSEMLSSPEYRLFVKYKLSEIRGFNFFDEILKRTRLKAKHH